MSSPYYHVDPASVRDAQASRYPRNFVDYPAFLAPIGWADRLSRTLRGRPMPSLRRRLLAAFDEVDAPSERWGTPEQLALVRRNIELFAAGIDDNPHISAIGRFLLLMITLGHLRNRAELIAYYEAQRDFIEGRGRCVAPLLVTGFPRTGTTLLHRLLSEDPNARAPYTFELEKTTPPMVAGADPREDPRIASSAASMATMSRLAPGFVEKFSQSHHWAALEREELMLYVQFHNGMTIMNGVQAGREYIRCLLDASCADALFIYERNFLTMLDAYAPVRGHWVNKAPLYAPYFSKLFDHYPDARVIVTHRHPAKNVASVCRMLESWMLPFDEPGSFDKLAFGSLVFEVVRPFLNAPMSYRDAHPERESQIVDCVYVDLFSDPIGTVKRIYAKFGLDYSEEFDQRMRRWLAENEQGRYGRHVYCNEEYGLEPERLQEAFGDYYDRYGFGLEPAALELEPKLNIE